MGQTDQRHLEADPGIEGFPHVDLGPAQHLDGSHQGREAQPFGHLADGVALRLDHPGQLGSDQGQESLAKEIDEIPGQLLGAEPGRGEVGHRRQGATGIPFRQGFDDFIQFGEVVLHRVRGGGLIQNREGVPGRPATPPDGDVDGLVGHLQMGVPSHLIEQLSEGVGPQQAEFVVLGAAPDGGKHLLRVGGGQHEDDVGRRFLQRLQQGVGRRGRQHVDLVDDVHLLPARRPERGPGDQVPHGIHTVVGGGVQLVDIQGGALGDLGTGRTLPARLTVPEVGAVQRLGQNPGGGGLAGPSRAAEEVGMGGPAVPHRIAKGEDHMVLPLDLGEGRRSEPAIQGLIRGVVGGRVHGVVLEVGHVGGAYRAREAKSPDVRCGGQVGYGTRPVPLRAAAFRP